MKNIQIGFYAFGTPSNGLSNIQMRILFLCKGILNEIFCTQEYPNFLFSFRKMSTSTAIPATGLGVTKKKSRKRSNITLHIPTSLQDVRDNYCIQALAQTTMDFCRESTLHGIKHIVVDIQELGSSYSRY